MSIARTGCTVDQCPEPHDAHGFCVNHHLMWVKEGRLANWAPQLVVPLTHRPCSVPGCPVSHRAKGFCRMHYRQWREAGMPADWYPKP